MCSCQNPASMSLRSLRKLYNIKALRSLREISFVTVQKA